MTVSKPPALPRRGSRTASRTALPAVLAVVALLLAPSVAASQETTRFIRLHLRDKGTPTRELPPGDPLYAAATAHLTPRALARRAKALEGRRQAVSTADLPIHPPYLTAIAATGATPVQSSRWLNTVMVRADSMTAERLRGLPFLASVEVVRAHPVSSPPPFSKFGRRLHTATELPAAAPTDCIDDHYGRAGLQNRLLGIDVAHRLGIAGEGVLVGVLDAGFESAHRAFRHTSILGQYDFLHGNTNTADEPEDSLADGSQEEHGTMVLSLIGATWRDTLVGGAPNAAFMLAKTEDLRYERHVEEDNFVAGLEWLEAQGVDITNTSLGYTVFDAPEAPNTYDELTGNRVPASRAVNRATELGVVCIVAAGNEGRGGFVYIGVPAEADSAIAVAAVDSAGRVAGFSSRGLPWRSPAKPEVAAFGVGNWAADPYSLEGLRSAQGTSFAAPMTTAVATLLLSAAPELRPWEVRAILQSSAERRPTDADTAVGAGRVHAGRALERLAESRIVAGVPALSIDGGEITVAVGLLDRGARLQSDVAADSTVFVRIAIDGVEHELRAMQPVNGIARWTLVTDAPQSRIHPVVVDVVDGRNGRVVRTQAYEVMGTTVLGPHSTLCATPSLAVLEPGSVEVYPNPFTSTASIAYELERDATVSLTIYNSRGEEVARLLEEAPATAGSHAHPFDARGLPSGSYYARLRVGDETRTGEMIFIP